ncbi:uncharacterized protein LOC110717749 [Chenopodium quinoa]|uniref:uncharacterized protein LOC110717749 n=1 Tax=Chenopodium quinoa TaxID=63459 RepID=UPI000B780B62|nr:uncharacterized protein LOC110717749 [Chenopodium quinoa]XP_021752205.1 uncharacterized protein LOC110717749 [Chenopodium quinoa]XP_021752206.1 uncharacterized protein LOC110717749 [Chenopodium quinoa]
MFIFCNGEEEEYKKSSDDAGTISTYPLSQPAISQTVVKKPLTLGFDQSDLNVGGACSSDTIGCFVQFELSDGVMTDDEIKQISTDVVHESFLLLKRNMYVFSSVQSKDFKTLSDLVTNVLFERITSLSFEDPVAVSQTQQLLSDPHYHKLLNGIIKECMKMKSPHEFFSFVKKMVLNVVIMKMFLTLVIMKMFLDLMKMFLNLLSDL